MRGHSKLAIVASSGNTRPWSNIHLTPLNNLPGATWAPTFSPDSQQVAFFWNGENTGRGDLYVQLIGDNHPLRLTHTRSGYPSSAAWSPDGREIAFGRCDDNGGGIYVVPALGGPERKLVGVTCPYGVIGHPDWTADGKAMVLADQCVPDGSSSIVLFSLEKGTKKCLTSPPAGEGVGDSLPALSPDKKTLAFVRRTSASVSDIYTIPAAGGYAHRITTENKPIFAIMWAADGRHISFLSARAGLSHVWRVSAEGGAIEAETVYPNIGALSPDGKRLAYVEPPDFSAFTSDIWSAALSRAGGKVIKLEHLIAGDAPELSPDSRQIAFETGSAGTGEIWKSNADGSNPLQLTSFGGHAGTPRWSSDGKWIAFDYRPSTHSQIFAIDDAGRNLHQITSGDYENAVPSWSRDGKAVYFASNRTGNYQIWRHELLSGKETQLTRGGGFAGFESADGKTVYFSKFAGGGLWTIPADGGEEMHIVESPLPFSRRIGLHACGARSAGSNPRVARGGIPTSFTATSLDSD
jgi:Tol biopolymer transport system component